METGVENLMSRIREEFALEEVDIRTYSPLVLAYIGDGIFELVIRSLLVGHGNAHAARLHKKASSLVNAGAQSAMLERIISSGGGATPIPPLWQSTRLCPITGGPPALRR